MIPYTHPHDSDQAGLRDYRARVEGAMEWPPAVGVSPWYRSALLVAMAALIGLLAFLLTGCAWHYPPHDGVNHLDAIHPSAERIAQLALAGLQPASEQSAWLRLSSPFVLAGSAVRLTCFLPQSRDHRYLRLGLIDAVSEIRVVTHATQFDELLIENVPCGSYAAVCESLANSNRVLVRLERPLTSKGSCNAEDK